VVDSNVVCLDQHAGSGAVHKVSAQYIFSQIITSLCLTSLLSLCYSEFKLECWNLERSPTEEEEVEEEEEHHFKMEVKEMAASFPGSRKKYLSI
jgi:hypothetical protein